MIKKANQEIQREEMACLYLLTLKTTYVKIQSTNLGPKLVEWQSQGVQTRQAQSQ